MRRGRGGSGRGCHSGYELRIIYCENSKKKKKSEAGGGGGGVRVDVNQELKL